MLTDDAARIRPHVVVAAALMTVLTTLASGVSRAQSDYPNKPIRVLVPYAAGGTDQQIRVLAPTFQRLLGQPLVIENREGGGGSVGAGAVKGAPPDGYTLLYTGSGVLTVLPFMRKGVGHSLDDFVPVGNVIGTPFIVAARPDGPFRTLDELVAWAAAHPEKVNFGTAGQGTTTHTTGEALQRAARIRLTHVPFQGIGPAVRSILGGNVELVIGLPSAIMPQVAGGKLLALATSGTERSEFAPDAPTMRERGYDVVEVTKFGLFAPRGTPEPVLQRLGVALAEAVKAPEFADVTKKTYNTIRYLDPATFRATLDAEQQYYRKLVRDLNLGEQ